MLELAILGFLRESPMHGYELKQHLNMLTGHFRSVSDGALYPAITRLQEQGFVVKSKEVGKAAASKHVLTLTSDGEIELLQRLRHCSQDDISDRNRFFTILAFLRFLPPMDQATILERRLTFLKSGRSFFQKDGIPTGYTEEPDIFRKGMLLIAKETSKYERKWLADTIHFLTQSNDS